MARAEVSERSKVAPLGLELAGSQSAHTTSQPIETIDREYVVLGPSDAFDPGPSRASETRLATQNFTQDDSRVFAGQRGDLRILTSTR
jgi:hypothetical protein